MYGLFTRRKKDYRNGMGGGYNREIGGGGGQYSYLTKSPRDQFLEAQNKARANQSSAYSQPQMSSAANQSTYSQNRSAAPQQTQPRTTTQRSSVIQGSGMGANYARNPQTYTPPAPKPQPQPQPRVPSLTEQYLQQRGNTALNRVGATEQRAQEDIGLQRELFDSRNKTLGNIGNLQRQGFEDYASQVRGGVDLRRGTAERQIGQAESMYEQNKYDNEQRRRERMKGLEGTLSSLGTLQSSALGNIGAKINMGAERQDRMSQENLTNRVADIQDEVRAAEYEAESLVQQEANRYQQQVAALAGEMDTNSLEFRNAVTNLKRSAEDTINSILDQYDNFAYQASLQAAQSQDSALSFDEQGNPENQATYEWMLNNPKEYEAMLSGADGGSESRSAEKVRGILGELSGMDTSGITGRMRYGFSDEARRAEGLLKQLSSELQLEEAARLKGQGSMSDAERAILANSIAAFNLDEKGRSKLSDDDFRYELEKLKQRFGVSDQGGDIQSVNQSLASQYGGSW